MLIALHITSVQFHAQMQCPILPDFRCLFFVNTDAIITAVPFFITFFNSRHASIKIVFVFRMASKMGRKIQESLDENMAQICHKH